MSEDEPFEDWAKRYLARRENRIGELRALPMDGPPGRGAHVNPKAPRLLMRWTGYQWAAEAVVDDYAAAQRLLHGIVQPQPGVPGWPLPKPTGRHHKPPSS
ncbi:DUF6087 family protein [Streptomyces sp. NPDC058525]|uniref:DUF6087 family protein n=1 Tax=Streptomyces sp. NPDC058525 TaxID=3346538 RepID=UPI003646C3A3